MRRLCRSPGLLLLAAATIAACGDEPRDAGARDSTRASDVTSGASGDTSRAPDTSARLTHDLPAGRFQLPTQMSPVPDLWITLPEGFRVKGAAGTVDDRFYVVHTDDPSASDTTATTPGFMRLYVGPEPQRPFAGATTADGERVLVAGQPLQWRWANESLSDGSRYYRSELASADIFATMSPEMARTPMHLHIYVAGADSARVVALMKSAESISIVP